MPSIRCLFLIQGEGRGHLTQALALRQVLAEAGHGVCAALVSRNPRRLVPAFFLREIGAPVEYLESPSFVFDARWRGIRPVRTLAKTLAQAPRYRASLRTLDAALARYRPDVVVNFYEPTGGLYYAVCRPAVPMVALAHQYTYLHPAHRFPPGHRAQRLALQAFTRLTAWGAACRLALALRPPPEALEAPVTVVPPLLRAELVAMPPAPREAFVLVYLLNRGYADELLRWHRRRPEVPVHCFWDQPQEAAAVAHDATLTFHRLDGAKFLRMMGRCRALATTAGFESVAEAMYLGIPVLAVPVAGHFEQFCNSRAVERTGAGLAGQSFDLDALLDFLPDYQSPAPAFRRWLWQGRSRYVEAVERVAMPAAPLVFAQA